MTDCTETARVAIQAGAFVGALTSAIAGTLYAIIERARARRRV